MTFDNILKDTICKCLNGTEINTNDEFIRKLKSDKIQYSDFLTHWERGIGRSEEKCEDICSKKALSINKLTTESKEQIIEKYNTTFRINPKKGSYILKFKIRENAGKIKYAPEGKDISHHNFFKSDTFNLENSIEAIDIVKIA